MFENQISNRKIEFQSIIETFNQQITNDEINSIEILDDFCRNFINAEMRWILYKEFLSVFNTDKFDLSNFDSSELFTKLKEYLINNIRFSKNEFVELIHLCIKIQINYLIRPHYTLNWFVFRNEPTKIYKEVSMRLDYFSEYKYLIDSIKNHYLQKEFDENTKEVVTSVELKKLIYNIDSEYIENLDFADFADLCSPIFNYFHNDQIPVTALCIFLDDKGLKKTSFALEKYCESNSITTLNKNKFIDIINHIENEIIDSLDFEDTAINSIINSTEVFDKNNSINEAIINEQSDLEEFDTVGDIQQFNDNLIEDTEEHNIDFEINQELKSEPQITDLNNETEEYINEDLSELTYDDVIERLKTKILIDNTNINQNSNFGKIIENLDYSENDFKNKLIDFYKSL